MEQDPIIQQISTIPVAESEPIQLIPKVPLHSYSYYLGCCHPDLGCHPFLWRYPELLHSRILGCTHNNPFILLSLQLKYHDYLSQPSFHYMLNIMHNCCIENPNYGICNKTLVIYAHYL